MPSFPVDAKTFERHAGRQPINDDLDKVNCPHVGQFGHRSCGWCFKCDKPRLVCMHLTFDEEMRDAR